MAYDYDLVVLGAGPAGEKGAAQAAYYGKRVACVERAAAPGGAAVHTGTLPSKTLLSALAADALTGTILTFVGLPGLLPLPWWQTLAIFTYAMVSCLVVNDALKVAMIKWRVPNAVAKNRSRGASRSPGMPANCKKRTSNRSYQQSIIRRQGSPLDSCRQ